ncbi:unnamed protein product, partial [Mesocestoides corti]
MHYFSRVLSDEPPCGTVTFSRRCLDEPPDFAASAATFNSIVNFANRFLGGGVLRGGCVQEEILCCIRPEIIVGRLFVEALEPHEALIIEGAERFSRYTGYASTFQWTGNFDEAKDAGNTRRIRAFLMVGFTFLPPPP